eukprot:581506-Hanusia_phi.AAC.2
MECNKSFFCTECPIDKSWKNKVGSMQVQMSLPIKFTTPARSDPFNSTTHCNTHESCRTLSDHVNMHVFSNRLVQASLALPSLCACISILLYIPNK